MNNIYKKIAEELNIRENQVEAAVKLIDEGNTIPFIARYRKEVTGNLSDGKVEKLSAEEKERMKKENREKIIAIIAD